MGVALKDLRGKVKRPVRSVSVCLDGDLWARYDELTAQLDAIRSQPSAPKLGDQPAGREVAEQIAAVEQQMRDAQVTIEFRGISSFQLAEIQARFPAKDGRGWDIHAGAAALIAACAVEPTTEEEARELLEELSHAVNDRLFSAAWEATTGSTSVPFSARASALIGD